MLILLTNLAQLSCVGELELDLQLGEISRQKSDEKVGFEEVEDSATIRESDSSESRELNPIVALSSNCEFLMKSVKELTDFIKHRLYSSRWPPR